MSKNLGPIANDLQKTSEEMTKLAGRTLEFAAKAGADAACIATSCSVSKRLVVEGNIFALANSLETQRFGVLVHKDHKKGTSSINTRSPEALEQAVRDGLDLAKFSVPDEALTLASPAFAPKAKTLSFQFDIPTAELSLNELQELMQGGLQIATKDKRVAIDKYEMSVETSHHGFFNSLGVAQQESQTQISWVFFGMAVDGEEVGGFDYQSGFSYATTDAAKRIHHDAQVFVDSVLRNLRPRSCPTYLGPILLTPQAVGEFFTDIAIYHAAGSSVMDGKSKWDKAIGQEVLSPLLTIKDSPHDPRLMGATAFDSDGVPTYDQTIFENGALKMHLHDCYSAKRTGSKTTASAGGPFGLIITPGKTPVEELYKSRDELLVVNRFSGNTDAVKGDFSGVAKNSRLFIKGKDAGAVGETMIAGNFFDICKKVIGVSKETAIEHGSYESPYILVDGVSVSGQ